MDRMASSCIALTSSFLSEKKKTVLSESAKCIRCLPDFFSPCPSPPSFFFFFLFLLFLPLSASSAALYRSVSVSPFWLVEDVSNLTASDVMNRVNLGYLQGNCVCLCVTVTDQRVSGFTSHRVERGLLFVFFFFFVFFFSFSHPFTCIHRKIGALQIHGRAPDVSIF